MSTQFIDLKNNFYIRALKHDKFGYFRRGHKMQTISKIFMGLRKNICINISGLKDYLIKFSQDSKGLQKSAVEGLTTKI